MIRDPLSLGGSGEYRRPSRVRDHRRGWFRHAALSRLGRPLPYPWLQGAGLCHLSYV